MPPLALPAAGRSRRGDGRFRGGGEPVHGHAMACGIGEIDGDTPVRRHHIDPAGVRRGPREPR
ncbi:hypothetical protein PITCH_A230086 [uncultured Desulfobacterium sp.]|uniref:Uncharacterized protein n=1 Tax=uncultured Desulfobacterium sp. TaxID=201089 RepID=A0A445MY25_9BACT|nr:hypothetical protein PITCH_A230086 [uncultured Desulfobacterium sp.]